MPVSPRATYKFTRFCFKREVIEPLDWSDEFRMITPAGTFQMSKADFYEVFSNVVQSRSYQQNGIYHSKNAPRKALRFLLRDSDESSSQEGESNLKPRIGSIGQSPPDAPPYEDTNEITRNISESNLELLLVERLELLEEGLQLIQRQYHCPGVGRIDILGRDNEGNLVVIELKKFGVKHDSILDQILRYMGYVKEHVAEGTQTVRGMIVVGKVDDKLRYAVSAVPNLTVKTFDVTIK
jgi:hypothetical protein